MCSLTTLSAQTATSKIFKTASFWKVGTRDLRNGIYRFSSGIRRWYLNSQKH